MEVLQKFKNKLPYDPAVPLLGIYLKKMKTLIRKDICIPYINCNIIYNNQDTKATQVSPASILYSSMNE